MTSDNRELTVGTARLDDGWGVLLIGGPSFRATMSPGLARLVADQLVRCADAINRREPAPARPPGLELMTVIAPEQLRPEWRELLAALGPHLVPVVIHLRRPVSLWLLFEIVSDAPRAEAVAAAVQVRDLFAAEPAFRSHVLLDAMADLRFRVVA